MLTRDMLDQASVDHPTFMSAWAPRTPKVVACKVWRCRNWRSQISLQTG